MKRAVIVAVVLTMVLGAGAVFAGGHGWGHHRGMKAMGPGGGPGPGVVGRLMRALHRLDLTDQQWSQIRSIVDAARPRIQQQLEAIRTVRDQLRDLDPANFDEAAVRNLAKQLAGPTEELVVAGEQVRSQVWAILTPEQRQQLSEMREQMEQRRECMRSCLGTAGGPGGAPDAPPAE